MRKRFPGEMTVLGGFEMTSQTMRVSDPCYDRDVWCCGTFGKCKTGTWEAGVLETDMMWVLTLVRQASMTRRSIRTTRSSRVCPSLSMTTETFGTTMPAISRSVRCRQASCPMASSPPPASAMAVMSATRTRVRMARSTSHSSFSLMSNCFLARECFGTPLAVSRRC